MGRKSTGGRRLVPFFMGALILFAGVFSWVFFFAPTIQSRLGWGWKILSKESKRILGWEKGEIPPEEKRIREEVILKKMEEASANQDWRSLAPEYPRPKKLDNLTGEERLKALKNSEEFKEIEKELKDYLKKKEVLLIPEPPMPSCKDVTDIIPLKDRGTEKIIERLVNSEEKGPQERPLEENLSLGLRGPLAARRILERPNLPPVKVKAEAEVELTLYVLPNGTVDRVVPSVRGDTELERIAIQYLRKWRFAPLTRDRPQVEQSGVIPIKFRLQ